MHGISIILVNYKNKVLTENCINSIIHANTKIDYEIIVIDNHSEDGSVEYLRKNFSDIQIVDSGRNGGFSFANNIGSKLASGKYLLLLNNDTEIYSNMLDDVFSAAENTPNIGLLGCRAVDKKGHELPIAHSYENLKKILLQTYIKPALEKVGLQRKVVSVIRGSREKTKEMIPADWIAGSAMLIRRDLYIELSGLDENFFMYMEDEDLGHRVNDAGYWVGLVNSLGYVHYCGGSSIPSYFLTKEYIKSRLIFFMRYESDYFKVIKRALFNQIRIVNYALSRQQIKQMKRELETFVQEEVKERALHIRGIDSTN